MPDGFKVERNDKVGRYGVAEKGYRRGETIFEELPVAFGPKSCSPVICLGCYSPANGDLLCKKCGWPVCTESCSEVADHSKNECLVFSASGVRFQPLLGEGGDPMAPCPQLECITPLRLLLAKEADPERWKSEVAVMESHCKKRRHLNDWSIEQVNVVDFLRKRCKLEDRFSDEEVHFVCGVLEVNSFEIRTSSVGGRSIRGLYPRLAILSHNCVANTAHSIIPGDRFRLVVRATVEVDEGQELFSSYTYSLAPTLTRRENLRSSKYFDCDCKRCSDPTELGTHMSSLKCTKCDDGLIMSTVPLDSNAQWKCTHCPFKLSADQVSRIYSTIRAEIDGLEAMPSVDTTIETAEHMMRQYRSVLHPKHSFMTDLRHCLCQLYGRAAGYTFEDLPDILLERKIELCQKVLEVADVVEPGYTRLRGLTLYEMHVPVMLFAQSQLHYGEIDRAAFCEKMEQVVRMLEEAVNILVLEDPESCEGAIGQMGSFSLEQLRSSLEAVRLG